MSKVVYDQFPSWDSAKTGCLWWATSFPLPLPALDSGRMEMPRGDSGTDGAGGQWDGAAGDGYDTGSMVGRIVAPAQQETTIPSGPGLTDSSSVSDFWDIRLDHGNRGP
jgi:hypothetical protein